MLRANQTYLRARHPRLFARSPAGASSRFVDDGLVVGDGWLLIIDMAASQFEQACLSMGMPFPEVLQVKEYLGTLRTYISGGDETLRAILANAEERSRST